MKIKDFVLIGLAAVASLSSVAAQLPVKEVTAFKDGHAFVVQEGPAAVNSEGDVVLDELPAPLIGTFWTYSTEKNAKLTSVTAGQHIVSVDRTALSLRELIEANPNTKAIITETNQTHYDATILGFPVRNTKELAATSTPNSREQLPQKSDLVLLKTDQGTAAVPLAQIQSVTFKDSLNPTAPQDEFRNFLKLKFNWGKPPTAKPNVGLVYVQKGIRWIPSYRVDIDGKSNAVVKLQAVVINDMIDLTNVTLNLVVGVPSFALKDTIDPMGLQETAAQLSQYFQSQPGRGAQFAMGQQMVSNLRQISFNGATSGGDAREISDSPADLPAGAKNEDLYVFTLHNVSLRKGERVLLPISEQIVPYHDVFTLDIPFAPPSELRQNSGTRQQMELARMMNAPKVMHKIRLSNKTAQPFTTAPAIIFNDGKLIAQNLMFYTAPGANTDLSLTAAIDIQVKKNETETKRVPDALVQNGSHYTRVDLSGKLALTNRRGTTTEIEINRYVLGSVDSASKDGQVEMANSLEDLDHLPTGGLEEDMPWSSFNWPWWWNRANATGHITWNVKLDPGQKIELEYAWHYFWM